MLKLTVSLECENNNYKIWRDKSFDNIPTYEEKDSNLISTWQVILKNVPILLNFLKPLPPSIILHIMFNKAQ